MVGSQRRKRALHKLGSAFQRATLSFPSVVQCNICGWRGRRFATNFWHNRTVCLRCSSKVRHRLLVAALSHIEELSLQEIIQNKRVLHFAPESLLRIFRTHAGHYLTADLYRENVDIRLDISKMPEIKDESFDVVVACDILEHVPEDTLALAEMHRILCRGGYAILTVPQMDHLMETFEDPIITTPERKRARIRPIQPS